MTVLTPLALLGLAAMAIPLLLHLLRRRETRTLVFPALRYLKRSTREHARIVRLRQLLLLAVRLSAILVLTLAGARLVLPLGGNDDPPAGVAIVLDNGLTSGAVVGEGRVLDSLVARAERALERMGPRDQIWIVPAGAPGELSLPVGKERAPEIIRSLIPTHVRADLPAALERARGLLVTAAPELRELVLVSDLRPESFDPLEPLPEPHPERIVIAPPPGIDTENRGIGDVLVSAGLAPRAGEPGEIRVTVVGLEVAGTVVRSYLDGRLAGSATANVDGTAILPLPRLPEGWVEGRVELEPDGLRADDVQHFAFRVIPAPTVRVTGSVTPFLEEALVVLEGAGRIARTEGPDATVELLGAGPGIGSSQAETVIVVPPDEAAMIPSVNQELGELLPGWRLEADAERTGTELLVSGGLLLDLLPVRPNVRVAHTIRTGEMESPPIELLSLADGRPWIVQAPSGGRSVIVLASPMSLEASGLPSSAAMLPLVELLVSGASGSTTQNESMTGQPIPIPDGATAVLRPDGTNHAVTSGQRFLATELAGVYRFLDPVGEVHSMVAVNSIPPRSGTGLTPEEAAGLLGMSWADVTVGQPWPDAVLRDRRGREVSRPLLFALLALLVAESWLASAGRRRSDRETAQGSPP